MSIDPKVVGAKIKAARIAAGFATPGALAKRLVQRSEKKGSGPMSAETVRQWETGERVPPQDKLHQLTKILGMDVKKLLFDEVPSSDSAMVRHDDISGEFGEGRQFQKPELRQQIMEIDREIADIVALWMQMPKAARTRYIRTIVEEGMNAKPEPWFDEIPDALLAKLSAHVKLAALKKPSPPETH